ncbi:SDR family oxidoreductase [Ramlibacter henchirensis]|uniref:SDR family oxidoreductase n=1 Tax=Ramlibacter henchirensis TaxID=204072 RepID=A0A4Z0BUF3_9BURK|nr:SDR family oxidoreductase [Ramlibacter henchirensis]TFZ02936.1 SDR family oxidoreductase [Ramlibacter henchirensis]
MSNYVNGIALVIGGTGHLGAAAARELSRRGVDVAVTYRHEGPKVRALVESAPGPGAIEAHQADLLDPASVRSVLEKLALSRRVHTVVYAAGIEVPQHYVSQVPRDTWLQAMQFELGGFFDAAQAAINTLRKGGGGSLVALTSSAIHRYVARDALSAVPKSAVEMLVRAIAREEGRNGIRANCVAPGLLEGGVGLGIIDELGAESLVSKVLATTPLRRLISAQDVAHAVAWLASDEAAAVTGQTLVVDCGQSA